MDKGDKIQDILGGGAELGELKSALGRLGAAFPPEEELRAKLERWYDMELPGLRRLLSCLLREFRELFRDDGRYRVYSTVPAPNAALMAFNSSGELRCFTPELCIMTVLGGVFGQHAPASCGCGGQVSRCAMLENRKRYIYEATLPKPELLWSFGLLCDEAAKTDELLAAEHGIKRLCAFCPRGEEGFSGYERVLREDIESLRRLSGMKAEPDIKACDRWLELSMLINAITCDNNSPQGSLLKPGTMSLIHSAGLMLFGCAEELILALREIKRDMKGLERRRSPHRLYCYYIPPVLPDYAGAFMDCGIELIGDAAFISCPPVRGLGRDIAGRCAAAWSGSVLSRSTARLAEETASHMVKYGCEGYLTGMFAFDRWLGNGQALAAGKIEELSGRPVYFNSTDFWGNGYSRDRTETYAETLRSLLDRER